MDIIIQSPDFKPSADLQLLINDKLEALTQHAHQIIRADVTLEKGAAGELNNSHCEIRLEVPGYDHFAKKSSSNFETAVHETIDVLTRKLHDSKDKAIASRRS